MAAILFCKLNNFFKTTTIMKQVLYYTLAALSLMGCTTAETDISVEEATKGQLSISGLNLSVGTKAIYDEVGAAGGTGNTLTQIGVLVTKPGTPDAVYYANNPKTQIFTCDASQKWTADTNLTLETTEGTVYAWAPASLTGEIVSSTPVAKSPVIPATQTFNAAHIWETSQVDYLYSTDGEASVEHPKVSWSDPAVATLCMQHALTKLSFKIMKADGLTINADDYVKQIKLTSENKFVVIPNPATDVTMSLADGTLAGTTTGNELTLTAATTWAKIAVWEASAGKADYADVTAQAYGLVAPIASAALGLELTVGKNEVSTDDDRIYATKAGELALKSVTWEKGKHYIYTMTVSDRGLSITEVKVAPWKDGGTTDVPVE